MIRYCKALMELNLLLNLLKRSFNLELKAVKTVNILGFLSIFGRGIADLNANNPVVTKKLKGESDMSNVVIEQNEASIRHEIYLPPQEIKHLYAIAQNGATDSINSLRDFLGMNVDIHLNCLGFLPFSILIDRIKLYYQNNIGFHLRFFGDIAGEIYTFFCEQDALNLIERMLGQKRKPGRGLNRVETSVLSELVNIISNTFWRALSEKTNLNWYFTPPAPVADLNRSLIYSAKIYNLDNLLLHFEYIIPLLEIRFQLIILPAKNTMNKILAKLSALPAPESE